LPKDVIGEYISAVHSTNTYTQQKGLKIVNSFLFQLLFFFLFLFPSVFIQLARIYYFSGLPLFTLITLSKSIIFQPWETLAFIFSYNPIPDTQRQQKNIKVLEEIRFPYYHSRVFHICKMGESEFFA